MAALGEANGVPATELFPLTAEDLPVGGGEPSNVTLTQISDVQNVNAIAAASPLEFPSPGLCVIYGDNGAGKSGYVRVLRRVARARAPAQEVRPNVFTPSADPVSATVHYQAGDTPRVFPWSNSSTPPVELTAVTVFDRDCAAVYVTRENQVAYRPFGLDLLDDLATAVESVKADLQQRRFELRQIIQPPAPDLLSEISRLGFWPLARLTNLDSLDGIEWSEDDTASVEQIARALAAESPVERTASLNSVAHTYERVLSRVRSAIGTVSTGVIDSLRDAASGAREAHEARDEVARGAFLAVPLIGVGGSAWRSLWEAARRFSESAAYTDRPFPHTGDGSRCVLCGQDLSEEAKARFRRFEDFVSEEATAQVEASEAAYEAILQPIAQLAESEDSDASLIDDLRVVDEDHANIADHLLLNARTLARSVLDFGASAAERPAAASDVEGLNLLTDASAAARREAEVAAMAADPGEVQALIQQRRNLQARQWIADHPDEIRREVDRLDQIHKIERAIASCTTNSITTESNELTQRYVTAQFETDLQEELSLLGASNVRVVLRRRGHHGATYHQIELDTPRPGNVPVDEVVSEGEFGALAVATFLAEVRQSPDASAIVFDDPVSSLDHLRRRQVARRLVSLAAERQVVVFTHDLVFLAELEAEAELREMTLSIGRLVRGPRTVGIPEAGPPWSAQKVRTRIDELHTLLAELRRQEDGDLEAYEARVRYWYGLLRETWERAVEEILFGGVVTRYALEVKTRSALSEKLWLMTESDVTILHQGMTKASAFLRGHDQPQAVNEPVPPPDEMAADLQQLSDWVASIRARRAATS